MQNFQPGYNDDDLSCLLENDSIMRSPRNKLFLDQRLHRLWSAGRFALKPMLASDPIIDAQDRDMGLWIRRDVFQQDYFVKVQFQWLPQGLFRPTDRMGGEYDISDLLSWTLQRSVFENKFDIHDDTRAFRVSGVPIVTGHIFTLRSTDRHRLPSFELLQLRYAFSHVTALAGFNNMTEDDWAGDSEGTHTPPDTSDDEDAGQTAVETSPENGNGEASRPRKRVRFE